MNNRLPKKKRKLRLKNRATNKLHKLKPTTWNKSLMIMEIPILMMTKKDSHKRLFKKLPSKINHRKLTKPPLPKSRIQSHMFKKKLKAKSPKKMKLSVNSKMKKKKSRKSKKHQRKIKSFSQPSMRTKERRWRRKMPPKMNSLKNKSSSRLISRLNLINSMRFLKRQGRRMSNIVTNSLEHKTVIMKYIILLIKTNLPKCQRKLRTWSKRSNKIKRRMRKFSMKNLKLSTTKGIRTRTTCSLEMKLMSIMIS
jgi:hypothetical protein